MKSNRDSFRRGYSKLIPGKARYNEFNIGSLNSLTSSPSKSILKSSLLILLIVSISSILLVELGVLVLVRLEVNT